MEPWPPQPPGSATGGLHPGQYQYTPKGLYTQSGLHPAQYQYTPKGLYTQSGQ